MSDKQQDKPPFDWIRFLVNAAFVLILTVLFSTRVSMYFSVGYHPFHLIANAIVLILAILLIYWLNKQDSIYRR